MEAVHTAAHAEDQIRNAIARLLGEQKIETGDRRIVSRIPFVRPIHLTFEDRGQTEELSCFSRDISRTGIGLLHNMPLKTGSVLISIEGEARPTRIRGKIIWCEPWGEGGYLSGATFTALAD